MRALNEGMASPHPLGRALPGPLQEDDFCQRFVAAFDTVLAPVFSALDNFSAYLDPSLAPGDFLEWLAVWVGVGLDDDWSVERRRGFVRSAAGLYRLRGTAAGLEGLVRILSGGDVEVADNGGTRWSATSGGDFPGSATPHVLVRIRTPAPASVDRNRIDAVISAVTPAHVPHTVEVLEA